MPELFLITIACILYVLIFKEDVQEETELENDGDTNAATIEGFTKKETK